MTTLLLVEDEHALRRLLAERLVDEGYKVLQAEDGLEGLRQSRAHLPDLIVSDIKMPNMNGIDFFTVLQSESPELASIPFIFLSANSGQNEIIDGMRLGVDGYLAKPVRFDLLLATIKSRLGYHQRLLDLLKSKLKSAFGPTFLNKSNAVGEYQSLGALFKHYSEIALMAAKPSVDFGLVRNCCFRAVTLEDAQQVSTILANMCPEPEIAIVGILEIMVNGIEHGNLGIGYNLKTKLMKNGRWTEEVNRRLEEPKNQGKFVEVTATRVVGNIQFKFVDCGDGFDPEVYRNFDPARDHDRHGRGIALSEAVSFDSIGYEGPGNIVTAVINDHD